METLQRIFNDRSTYPLLTYDKWDKYVPNFKQIKGVDHSLWQFLHTNHLRLAMWTSTIYQSFGFKCYLIPHLPRWWVRHLHFFLWFPNSEKHVSPGFFSMSLRFFVRGSKKNIHQTCARFAFMASCDRFQLVGFYTCDTLLKSKMDTQHYRILSCFSIPRR